MRTKRRTLGYVDEDTAVYRAFKAAQKPKQELTQKQRAKKHWAGMNARVKTEQYASKGIKVLWSYEEFEAWFCSEQNKAIVDRILIEKEIPSIDRISSAGHYEVTNCRIIPKRLNCALGEVNALVSRMKTLQAYLKDNEHWLRA